MRFTSLAVELIRARPRLTSWLAVVAIAAIWVVMPGVFYASPPGHLAATLAFGREYLLSTGLEPPLAPWLADIAFRLAGHHVIGVYLLSQACFVATFFCLFKLGRVIVGPAHAALAVLLTVTISAFTYSGVAFGPGVLAQPLWAFVLLQAWRIMAEPSAPRPAPPPHPKAWLALSIAAGLLLLTSSTGWLLLLLLGGFALATARGRCALISFDTIFAALIIGVIVLPYGVVAVRNGAALPAVADFRPGIWPALALLGGLLLSLAGFLILLLFNMRVFSRDLAAAPTVTGLPVDRFSRGFVFYFAVAPVVLTGLISGLLGRDDTAGGSGAALVLAGLAAVVATGQVIALHHQRALRRLWGWIVVTPALFVLFVSLVQPWIVATEVSTMLPARAIGQFFGDSYVKRTGQPLRAVAGDPQLAELIGFAAPSRPHVLLDDTPQRTPWLTLEQFNAGGGVVVWRAADTAGSPPPSIAERFPGLVAEVPQSFSRYVNGRQPVLRIGWAIIRPKTALGATAR
jgi:hypothetical protein